MCSSEENGDEAPQKMQLNGGKMVAWAACMTARLTLYGRVRDPLCGGCCCRPMQPMGYRKLTPKGLRCNGSSRLYGKDAGILYGPGIAGDAFPLLYRKPGRLVTYIDP